MLMFRCITYVVDTNVIKSLSLGAGQNTSQQGFHMGILDT